MTAREGSMTRGESLRSGVLAAMPLVPGLVSVGVLYGVTALASGMSSASTMATSLLVATGTAQFMAVELLSRGTEWWLVVLTGLLVNLRFAIYTFHLGDFARGFRASHRWGYFAITSDEGYALTVPYLGAAGEAQEKQSKLRWSAGLMMAIWLAWQVGTFVGVTAGAVIPSSLALERAIPITLLTVLVLLVLSPRHVVVALAAGLTALLLRHVPWNLGFVGGIAAGVCAGMTLDAFSTERTETFKCTA